MKKLYLRRTRSIVLFFNLLFVSLISSGQQNEPLKITSIEKTVAEFQCINIESNCDVYIFEGTGQKVIIETEEQLQNNVVANVAEGCLNIFQYHKTKASKIHNIFITVSELHKLTVSGKCKVKFFYNIQNLNLNLPTSSSNVTLILNSQKFNCNVFGKGNVCLKGNYNELSFSLYESALLKLDVTTNLLTFVAYDMSEATIAGICEELTLNIFDDASIGASDLAAKKCHIFIKDSGEAYVSIQEKLEIFGEQDGFVEYQGEPELNIIASKTVKIKCKKDKMFTTGK